MALFSGTGVAGVADCSALPNPKKFFRLLAMSLACTGFFGAFGALGGVCAVFFDFGNGPVLGIGAWGSGGDVCVVDCVTSSSGNGVSIVAFSFVGPQICFVGERRN